MYQYEAVKKIMEDNGGYATLRQLYKNAPKVSDSEWKTKTPNASIRRIVQRKDMFFKIRPGLWALKEYKDDLPESVYSGEIPKEKKTEYDHTYFQGLITELGNFEGMETFVPAQDQNKKYLEKKLEEVADRTEIYNFGYENLVSSARTVDVVWFNQRRMPTNFFEVEFSTNFQRSLIKFADLQDYHAGFSIVADSSRKNQYEKKISSSAFDSIRNRVKFYSFEKISELHSRANVVSKVKEEFGV